MVCLTIVPMMIQLDAYIKLVTKMNKKYTEPRLYYSQNLTTYFLAQDCQQYQDKVVE